MCQIMLFRKNVKCYNTSCYVLNNITQKVNGFLHNEYET